MHIGPEVEMVNENPIEKKRKKKKWKKEREKERDEIKKAS